MMKKYTVSQYLIEPKEGYSRKRGKLAINFLEKKGTVTAPNLDSAIRKAGSAYARGFVPYGGKKPKIIPQKIGFDANGSYDSGYCILESRTTKPTILLVKEKK